MTAAAVTVGPDVGVAFGTVCLGSQPRRRPSSVASPYAVLMLETPVRHGPRCSAMLVLCCSYASDRSRVFRPDSRETVLVRDRGVGGSNPLAPTTHKIEEFARESGRFCVRGVSRRNPLSWRLFGTWERFVKVSGSCRPVGARWDRWLACERRGRRYPPRRHGLCRVRWGGLESRDRRCEPFV